MGEGNFRTSIFAPLTGKVVDLTEVPDSVYGAKLMGEGVAIIPEEGTMFSPITGRLNLVADDRYAFGFTSDDGLEILVHMGVKSKYQPDCCAVHVKENSRVQAGDLIAEFDLEKMEQLGISLITPVIICGGLEGKTVTPASGHVQAGSGEVITVIDEEAKARYEAELANKAAQPPQPKPEKKHSPESEVIAFLKDRRNWPRILGGLFGLTAVLVIVFVGVAMLIGR